MLLTKTVLVKPTANRIKHYEDRGYYIPRIPDKHGVPRIPWGTSIEVKVEDLPKNSHFEVECKCDDCGDSYTCFYQDYNEHIEKYGKSLCPDCVKKHVLKKKREDHIKKVGSVETYCLENNMKYILDMWNNELNELSPSEICINDNFPIYLNCLKDLTHDIIEIRPLNIKKYKGKEICKQCEHESKLNGNVNYKYNIGDIINNNIMIIDRKVELKIDKSGNRYYRKYYKIKCLNCSFDSGEHYYNGNYKSEHWVIENNNITCPCCCSPNKAVVKGINDVATTHPHLVKYFKNKEDCNRFTINSEEIVDMICPDCNDEKSYRICDLKRNNGIACNCRDKVPYPEKFMYYFLKINNIDFIWQLTSSNLDWIKDDKRYDFYFEYNNESYIVECHGGQHYKECSNFNQTLEEQNINDEFKYKMAIDNGIKHYISLDCRHSNNEWIRNSIENSELSNIFDLDNIDWLKVEEYSLSNMVKEVCEYFESHKPISIPLIAKLFNMSLTTVNDYLHKGNKLGFCDYNPKKNKKETIGITRLNNHMCPVKLYDKRGGNLITICKNIRSTQIYLEENYNHKVCDGTIRECCRHKNKTPRKFYYEYATEEEFYDYEENNK